MFNFKDELTKFKPILEMENIENELQENQIQDLFDILEHMSKEKETTMKAGNKKEHSKNEMS